jgi:hypothetical protein
MASGVGVERGAPPGAARATLLPNPPPERAFTPVFDGLWGEGAH